MITQDFKDERGYLVKPGDLLKDKDTAHTYSYLGRLNTGYLLCIQHIHRTRRIELCCMFRSHTLNLQHNWRDPKYSDNRGYTRLWAKFLQYNAYYWDDTYKGIQRTNPENGRIEYFVGPHWREEIWHIAWLPSNLVKRYLNQLRKDNRNWANFYIAYQNMNKKQKDCLAYPEKHEFDKFKIIDKPRSTK